MDKYDKYCNDLLEEAKRFLEIAKTKSENYQMPYLHASILISISSLESFVYGISDDFKDSRALTMHEIAFLSEKEILFENGKFQISNKLKMNRLIERIEFIFQRFKQDSLNKNNQWWSQLNEGIRIRNSIVHPKECVSLTYDNVSNTLKAIIQCINELFLVVYKRKFPKFKLGLNSKLNFE
ncbi:MAG TPA: hypothetical protein PK419_00285 [Spirochaetota bacterium]|jgi:hypothetical protein|nr:hypothetical protein [Spirochaetota bacterium]HOH36970.1 hypothetical protein [Spirochaetota bacterium]HPJ14239.1 hypothetical protein [Spirochaetota bacterium]HPY03012.1 hypothetical protein [Spirochaetota bacterium]HQA51270.1 hypothetical protein [Spirochaetota bacterium]